MVVASPQSSQRWEEDLRVRDRAGGRTPSERAISRTGRTTIVGTGQLTTSSRCAASSRQSAAPSATSSKDEVSMWHSADSSSNNVARALPPPPAVDRRAARSFCRKVWLDLFDVGCIDPWG